MKKFPLFLIFSILCIQLSYSNSISKDKKKTSEVPYLNSAMGTSRFHRITDYLILNAIPFSFDYTSLANKSAQAEDSIPVLQKQNMSLEPRIFIPLRTIGRMAFGCLIREVTFIFLLAAPCLTHPYITITTPLPRTGY